MRDRHTRYCVEARNEDGSLCFDCPQPPVRDWTEDDLAREAWKHNPEATLDGRHLALWLSANVHPKWKTRVKTW